MVALRKDLSNSTVPLQGPSTHLVAITPSDSTDLSAEKFKALWVGGAGNIAVLAVNDSSAVTISGVAAGTLIPIMAKKVMSTNTTATLIVGLG
jgi:hypothetical protein